MEKDMKFFRKINGKMTNENEKPLPVGAASPSWAQVVRQAQEHQAQMGRECFLEMARECAEYDEYDEYVEYLDLAEDQAACRRLMAAPFGGVYEEDDEED